MSSSAHPPLAVRVRRDDRLVHIEEVWSPTIAVALATHYSSEPNCEAEIVDIRDHRARGVSPRSPFERSS